MDLADMISCCMRLAHGLSQTEDEQASLEHPITLMGKNQGSGLRTRGAQQPSHTLRPDQVLKTRFESRST